MNDYTSTNFAEELRKLDIDLRRKIATKEPTHSPYEAINFLIKVILAQNDLLSKIWQLIELHGLTEN